MTIQSSVADAMRQAKEFAQEIIDEKAPQKRVETSSAVVVHHHYHDYYPIWGRPPCFGGCFDSCVKKDKKDMTGLIIVVSVLVILTASYLLGADAGKWSAVSSYKQNLNDRKISIIKSNDPAKHQAVNVLGFQDKMLDSMKSDAKIGLALKASIIGSAALTIVGVVTEGTVLAAGGMLSGVGFGLASLYRWGYSSQDTLLQEKAVHLNHLANEAQPSKSKWLFFT